MAIIPASKLLISLIGGVVAVSGGIGIYQFSSSNTSSPKTKVTQEVQEKVETPKCRIFFAKDKNSGKKFEETTLEELKSKNYTNHDKFIPDVEKACEGTDLQKPNYQGRVYVTEDNARKKGNYSNTNQESLGKLHHL